jgi:hypothetical protein
LTSVFPTWTPSPLKKLIAIRGPSFSQFLMSSEIPMTAAAMGTTHTNRGIQLRL